MGRALVFLSFAWDSGEDGDPSNSAAPSYCRHTLSDHQCSRTCMSGGQAKDNE